MRSSRGFTFIETMVAGAILAFVMLALFEGVTVAARLSRENAEILQAEGIVWDAVWMAFNEDYERLSAECTASADRIARREATLPEAAAPLLARYDTAPVLDMSLSLTNGFICIEGDVTWGGSSDRRCLSDTQRTFVWRSPMGRVVSY